MKPDVLIIDDSLTVRMDLGEAFELAGFAAMLCSNVAEARGALLTQPFALIILDVLLPDADGIEFLREIKNTAATAEVPVMLLSSEAEVQDRIRGLNTGADEYVGKPYDQSYVVARARELVRKLERKEESDTGKPAATKVLIIDDSPTFREELKSALGSSGYLVITAATGEDGLRVAVDERPAAIVVDGVLPGIDGATVIRRIRADAVLRRTPCILLTASEEASGEIEALDAGADDYVRKGEDVGIVLARVAAVLRSSGSPTVVCSTSSLLGPKRVLAVDDSLTYLQEIAGQLRQEGYEVVCARSGEEAVELLSVQAVDCILLDLVMPGWSGKETCRRIKSSTSWRDIPLILHTALEEEEAMIEGINAGADDYIAKSSDIGVLRARVRAQLRRKQFEDENRNIREQLLQKELEVVAANAARKLAEARAAFSEELELKNKELEAFSYSVSHDLRAPLRAISGFSHILAQEHQDKLDANARELLQSVQESASRMGRLIDDLLKLAKTGRKVLDRETVDLSDLAREIASRLQASEPGRDAAFVIAPNLIAKADRGLLQVVLENLLGNAWKFTSKRPRTSIELGVQHHANQTIYFVRDNGAGFDMKYADKLFGAFQRLHYENEFPGTGIGLATVQKIIHRHGGRVWAESQAGQGATFYFVLERVGEEWLSAG
ncbi:MAG TPA: response regulator [Candidatus Angelobacter sp.]|nr:response regulator [Candidatus Angelobacter sp.]